MLERGDVYLASLNFPNNSNGIKYVVILQSERQLIFKNSPTVTVMTLTTRRSHSEFPTDVYVPPEECGNAAGVRIVANQIFTIYKNRLIKHKYTLSQSTLEKMDFAISVATGLIEI